MSTIVTNLKAIANKTNKAINPVSETQHQEVIELLRGRTMEMSFTVHGLPKSRKIKGKLSERVAASVSGKQRGVRASWSMFTSEHPTVKELNQVIRELEQLRDTWTIVRAAEVKTGDSDKVTIEGGKRLIWDKDIPEFYSLFVAKAQQIDLCVERLQVAMRETTYDADDRPVPSVMQMDKENAGEAWDESVYPKDLNLVVGVAKERNPDGSIRYENEKPVYVISFSEYHVSEKLPALLQERAIQRIDAGLSGTVETAMTYAVNELTDQMMTFLGELSNRVKVYPSAKGPFGEMYEGEIIKRVTSENDNTIPAGAVKALIRYKGDDNTSISKWIGPVPENKFNSDFRPQTTAEKKKIYPSVVENIVTQLTAFRDKKAKMLGVYGEQMVEAFSPLLDSLLAAKKVNTYASTSKAAQLLVSTLKSDEEAKAAVSKVIVDVVASLEDQVATVKDTHKRRRCIKPSLMGKV